MSISNPSFGVGLTATVPLSVGQASGNISVNHQVSSTYAVGSAGGQADTVYTAARTVPSSSSADSIDLSSLTDPSGASIAFLHVTDLLIQNTDESNTLTVGGGSDAVTWLPSGGIAIPPGACVAMHDPAGLAVTTSTADHIQVAASGGTDVAYNVTVFGRSA